MMDTTMALRNILISCAAFLAGVILVYMAVHMRDPEIQISPADSTAPVGGMVFVKVEYRDPVKRFFIKSLRAFDVVPASQDSVRCIKKRDGFYITSSKPARVSYTVTSRTSTVRGTAGFTLDVSDRDHDGFPDAAELITDDDRSRFRAWFAAIAYAQYYKKSALWYDVHQDCSGLLIFAFKEALKVHDENWFRYFGAAVYKNIPDVARYHYPEIPVLGDRPFRTVSGAFLPDDVDAGRFSASANVNILLNYNLDFVSKNTDDGLEGDILIYCNEMQNEMPYHSMILLSNGRVIYHTGPGDADQGEVRLVKLEILKKHPDSRWHPVRDNPSFLGVFRWKILN